MSSTGSIMAKTWVQNTVACVAALAVVSTATFATLWGLNRKDLTDIKTQLDNTKESVSELTSELKKVKADKANADSEKTRLKDDKANLEGQLGQAQVRIQNLESSLEAAGQDVQDSVDSLADTANLMMRSDTDKWLALRWMAQRSYYKWLNRLLGLDAQNKPAVNVFTHGEQLNDKADLSQALQAFIYQILYARYYAKMILILEHDLNSEQGLAIMCNIYDVWTRTFIEWFYQRVCETTEVYRKKSASENRTEKEKKFIIDTLTQVVKSILDVEIGDIEQPHDDEVSYYELSETMEQGIATRSKLLAASVKTQLEQIVKKSDYKTLDFTPIIAQTYEKLAMVPDGKSWKISDGAGQLIIEARGRVKEDSAEFYSMQVNLSTLSFKLPDVSTEFMTGVQVDRSKITQSVRRRAVKHSCDSELFVGRRRNISSELNHADDSELKQQ